MIGPIDAAELWGDKGGEKAGMEVLKAWIGTGRRKGLGRTRRRVKEGEDDDAALENATEVHGLADRPSPLVSSSGKAPGILKRYARSDDSGNSSDEGGSDNHARTAWKLFGVGELEDACKTWLSPSPQSESQVRLEAVVDIGTLPTPTSSPLPRERRLGGSNKGKERAIDHALQSGLPLAMLVNPSFGQAPTEITTPPANPDPSRLTSLVSACTSPFVSFDDIRFPGQPLEEQTNEVVGPGSQPFACLDNVVLSDPSQNLVASHPLAEYRSQSQPKPRLHGRNLAITQDVDVGDVRAMADVENVGEVSPPKRRRIDQEESEVKVDEKGDVPEFAGGKLVQVQSTHLTSSRREEGYELSHKSSIGLTRTLTVPSATKGDDKKASLPPTSSALEVEGVLGAFPQSSPGSTATAAVTATATISFPVRKRVEDRVNFVGKTASLSGTGRGVLSPRTSMIQFDPGPPPCSTSAIVRAPVLAVERMSTVVMAESHSTYTSARTGDAPVSPRTAARRAERAERRRITEKLRLARPDLVVGAQASRRGSRGRGLERVATSTSTIIFTSETELEYGMNTRRTEVGADNGTSVTEEDAKMDWDKSQRLAARVREALKRGESASKVLPRLSCLERWYAERA